jgi:hypothetical protein
MPLGIALQSLDLNLAKRIISEINYHDLVEAVLPHLDYMDVEFKKKLLTEISYKKVLEGIFMNLHSYHSNAVHQLDNSVEI